MFTYLFFLVAAALLFGVGFSSTRKTGVLKCGQLAGAIAGALPCLALAIGSNLSQLGSITSKGPNVFLASVVGYIIAALLIAGIGAVIGAAIGTPGALVGRAGYREARLAQPYLDFLQPEVLSAVTSPLELEKPQQPGPPPASIAIYPSRPKLLMLSAACVLFVWASLQGVQAGPANASHGSFGYFMSWLGLGLFGLALPLTLFTLISPWPVLQATAEGIEYTGWPFPWTRRYLPWTDVVSIRLEKATGHLLGKYDLILRARTRPRFVAIRNGRLPRSIQSSLRLIAEAYGEQIRQHEVRVTGIQ